MFIDYLTIMLVNLAAGLTIMALFVLKYINGDRKKVAPGFLVSGFLALVTGFHVIFTWPIMGSYNIPFGEMSVLFGLLFFAAGIAVLRDWDLLSLGVYGIFAGAASIVLGIRLFDLKMTNEPRGVGRFHPHGAHGGSLAARLLSQEVPRHTDPRRHCPVRRGGDLGYIRGARLLGSPVDVRQVAPADDAAGEIAG